MDKLELSNQTFYNFAKKNDIENWHRRLGHSSMSKLYLFSFLKNCNEKELFCEDCILGKIKSLPFGSSHFIFKEPFELIYSDVWDLHQSCLKEVYPTVWYLCITLLDIHGFIFLDSNLKYYFGCFQKFHSYVKNQFKASIIIFRAVSGREFIFMISKITLINKE